MDRNELLMRYKDLLPEGKDERAERLVAALHDVLATPEPPDGLARAFLPRLVQGGVADRSVRHEGIWPLAHGWVATAIAVTLLLSALATGAIAISPLVARLWEQDRGLSSVERTGQIRELGLREDIGGIAVTLERAYADPNRIAIGYTVDLPAALGPNGEATLTRPVLTDSSGRSYPLLLTQTAREARSTLGATVVTFDGEGLPVDGGDVSFELEVAALRILGTGRTEANPLSGPWTFRFTLPVQPGRSLRGEVATADDRLGLVRFVATPSESRAYLRLRTSPADLQWSLSGARLEVGDRNFVPEWIRCADERCLELVLSFADVTWEERGLWRLVVEEIAGFAPIQPTPGVAQPPMTPSVRLTGPWTFVFTVH